MTADPLTVIVANVIGKDLAASAAILERLEGSPEWPKRLVNRAAPADEACGGTLVAPGDASASYLFQKLSSSSPCSGLQMPRGELGAEPLPACVVNLISAWIEEGAPPPVDGGG